VQRSTRTRNKVINIQTFSCMFYILEKFKLMESTNNVNNIYKSLIFSIIENFDDNFFREFLSINLSKAMTKLGLDIKVVLIPLLVQ